MKLNGRYLVAPLRDLLFGTGIFKLDADRKKITRRIKTKKGKL